MNQKPQNDDHYIFKAIWAALWVVLSWLLSVIWFIFAFVVNSEKGIFDNIYRRSTSRLSYEAPWKAARRERAIGQQNAEYRRLRLENERIKHEVLMEQKRRPGI